MYGTKGENTMNDMIPDTKDIDEFVRMLDRNMNEETSRLQVSISEQMEEGESVKQYHHGRCDIGSPWAKGTVSNCDIIDNTD